MRTRGGRVRAAVPPGVLARDRREARRRQGRDRGHRSRSGSAASATCAPPRATARSTRSTARCARRSARSTRTCATSTSSTSRCASSTRRKGTGAVTRVLIDASDGHDVWGSIGVSENVIAASWDALVDSLEYGMQPAPRRPLAERATVAVAPAGPSVPERGDPARPAGARASRRSSAVLEVLRSGQLSLGPRARASSSGRSPRSVGAPLRERRLAAAPRGLHLALRAVGVGEGDEVITSPFSFVASANAALYERARPVFADIDPVTLNLDPERRRGGRRASARGRSCRCTSSATPPTCPRSSGSPRSTACAIVEDACEALGARPRRRRRRRRARASRRCSASTPTSS